MTQSQGEKTLNLSKRKPIKYVIIKKDKYTDIEIYEIESLEYRQVNIQRDIWDGWFGIR